MEQFKPFFGEIVGRTDLDFLNAGNREAIVQTNNVLTNNNGGIVNGLDVSVSPDKLSVLINAGVFYTSGIFGDTNNSGGGERGELLTQQFFTTLPETAPIANQPSYLLVYAKIINSNTNPDPLKSSAVVTSKNLQTGENVATREYSRAVIVVTNPLLRSTALTIAGVPLALIQVNYVGTNKVASNGSIQSTDTTIRRNYIVGGSVDVNNQKILDAGVPDNFLTTRMFADNQVSGPKFQDNSIGTIKLAIWDGVTAYNDLSGSGVANQNLKNGAVTQSKLNYKLSLNELATRNRLVNSSFETFSGSSATLPANWNITEDLGTNIAIEVFTPSIPAKFGNNSLLMQGGIAAGPNTALNLQISQIVDFNESIANTPISAFFWAKEVAVTSFATSGTSGLHGTIEFLDSNVSSPAVLLSQTFGLVSGVSSTDYVQYSTDTPVLYSGATRATRIRYTVGGAFNGTYLVDGAFLATSALIPRFDVTPSEYVTVGAVNVSLLSGQIIASQIADGAVVTSKVRNADGTNSTDTGFGILGTQIRPSGINTINIADGAITSAKLAPGTGLVPQGAVIIWDQSTVCPSGFTEAVEFRGFFPLGKTLSGVLSNVGTKSNTIGGSNPAVDETINKTATEDTAHNHDVNIGGGDVGGAGTARAFPGDYTTSTEHQSHAHSAMIPFYTVMFCRKT